MAIIYPSKNEEFSFIRNTTSAKALSTARQMDLPLDIEKLIKTYNITICKEDMDDDISGYIEERSSGWFIGVNKYHPELRTRFTLAHEFAHYILHKDKIGGGKHQDMSLFRANHTDSIEVEANNFASELLIPEEKFEELITAGTKEIGKLAKHFNVSILAIRYKAHKLGYLNRV